MDQLAKAIGEDVVKRDLVPAFVKLLKDNEAEVRTAIAAQIPGQCALLHFLGLALTTPRLLPTGRSRYTSSRNHVQHSGPGY